MESLQPFLTALAEWGQEDARILGIAIVGSHARGTAGPDSDIDVILIVDTPLAHFDDIRWIARFGTAVSVTDEDWGLVQSLRVRYDDGKEVEFGFTTTAWASVDPIRAGDSAGCACWAARHLRP